MKRLLFMCSLAAVAVLSGCSKENGGNPNNGNGVSTVLLTVEKPDAAPARTAADKITDHQLELKEGYIFFVESSDVIVRYLEMKTGATPGNENELEFGDVTSGVATIKNVKTSATKCYIFSNIPSGTKTVIEALNLEQGKTKIDVILNLVMGLNDLVDSDGGIANMPQFGVGSVLNNTNPMTTSVSVNAMGSRLQIEKLTGITDIVSYKLDGIFVNNYFIDMPVSTELDIDDIKNNGSVVANYTQNSPAYQNFSISDYEEGDLADITGLEATPKTKEVWAYNIWPTEGVDAADRPDAMPHIIFVLSEVMYKDDQDQPTPAPASKMYLTVKGMKDADGPLTQIKKGNSYTYPNIQFSYENLTTVPEVESIDATVTINMMTWKDNEVEEIL